MEVTDYYCPTTLTSTVGYGLGRGARAITLATVETINPLKAGAVVAVAWGGIAAFLNTKKYKTGVISKRDALLDTAGESAGIGVAAGLGLVVSNAIRVSAIALSTSTVVPFTLGVLTTASAKVLWDCHVKRNLKCEANRLVPKGEEAGDTPANA